ncbi:hypothetical protein Q4Q67_17245 [Morganella morganii]|uniref:transcriptional antitermination N peptide n=1 Tax=Morganella morganii TaxID=582 RepID=UPI001FB84D13|nr:hypothetical protein [Morganella morganii]
MSNFRGYSNSRSSRMERRKALKESYEITKKLKVAINGEPEAETKRPVLSLNRKHIGRVDKVVAVSNIPVTRNIEPKIYDSLDNCCLPHVHIFSVNDKKNKTITAR